MPTLTNNNTRIFYATQAVTLGAMGDTSDVVDGWTSGNSPQTGAATVTHGVQSINVNTSFNLEQAFELGQLSLYENIEDVPDIEVTMEKVLDGYPLLYHLSAAYDSDGTVLTSGNTTLSNRADARADLRMVINASTEEAVTSGDALVSELYCSGMYLSSVSYTIPTDGSSTESVSLVGNDKRWINDPTDSEAVLIASDSGVNDGFGSIFGSDEPNYAEGVLRREDVQTGTNGHRNYHTVVPTLIEGVTQMASSGFKGRNATNAGTVDTENVHMNSFTCSVDLGREQINQLGTRLPYNRYAQFPTEVTSEIEMIATAGDNVDAQSSVASNLSNHEICIVLKDSTVIHLGKKNKLSSTSFGGGDATGGNAAITYSFSNFNDFVILHSGDPIRASDVSDDGYWADKFAT